jgi:hypothetical protein
VKANDTIRFVSATGFASFAEETKNESVGSLIGIVAAGATVAADSFGAPELAPVIGAAETFAREQFKEQKVKAKVRDPFGQDTNGGRARQEGGVLVSMPMGTTTQIFSSGDSDHEGRWIKKPGTRDPEHFPNHVHDAFFLQIDSDNTSRAAVDGDLIIYPWDEKYEDNFGFYRLHALLERGDPTDNGGVILA